MSTWKELPRPATPGPWVVVGTFESGGLGIEHHASGRLDDPKACAVIYANGSYVGPTSEDAAAIAALPEYVAEVDRLRAWVDAMVPACEFTRRAHSTIRAGEWPEGRKP